MHLSNSSMASRFTQSSTEILTYKPPHDLISAEWKRLQREHIFVHKRKTAMGELMRNANDALEWHILPPITPRRNEATGVRSHLFHETHLGYPGSLCYGIEQLEDVVFFHLGAQSQRRPRVLLDAVHESNVVLRASNHAQSKTQQGERVCSARSQFLSH